MSAPPPSKDKTPADFASDSRYTLNKETNKWSYVGDDGVCYEYDESLAAWFPMVPILSLSVSFLYTSSH